MPPADPAQPAQPDAARVLLLLPTTTYRAPDFLAAARSLGCAVVVGTDRKQSLADEAPAANLTVALDDEQASVAAIVEHARRWPLDAVVGVDDATVGLAARASRALGLRSASPEAVALTRDKHAFRARTAAAGLSTPGHRLVDVALEGAALSDVAATLPYPCVLKPTFLSASRGVIRADDPAAFARAHRRVAALLAEDGVRERAAALPGAPARRILVEDFVPGAEVALEGLLRGGTLRVLALFDKPDPLDGPYFEETLYVTPSRAPDRVQRAIERTVVETAAALGLDEGPVHAELRVEGERVTPLEVAARTIGGHCSRALRFGAGLSLEELVLRHALDRPLVEASRERRAAGVLMLPVPRAGVLGGVDGVEDARAVAGIDEVEITIPAGQAVRPLPEGDRYLGFVFARADRPGEVEAALREARARLRVRVAPPEGEGAPATAADHLPGW